MTRRPVNPATMHTNPAFSQAVVGDTLAAPSAQAFANLTTVLAEEGAGLEDVVTWTIAVAEDSRSRRGWAPPRRCGTRPTPTEPGPSPFSLTLDPESGASWNRTNDLALIRGAL